MDPGIAKAVARTKFVGALAENPNHDTPPEGLEDLPQGIDPLKLAQKDLGVDLSKPYRKPRKTRKTSRPPGHKKRRKSILKTTTTKIHPSRPTKRKKRIPETTSTKGSSGTRPHRRGSTSGASAERLPPRRAAASLKRARGRSPNVPLLYGQDLNRVRKILTRIEGLNKFRYFRDVFNLVGVNVRRLDEDQRALLKEKFEVLLGNPGFIAQELTKLDLIMPYGVSKAAVAIVSIAAMATWHAVPVEALTGQDFEDEEDEQDEEVDDDYEEDDDHDGGPDDEL